MKAELIPENGDPPIPITRDVTVVGRREYCDVRINDPSLSKRHCVLVKTDGLLVVRDLATTNGTKVKGQRIRWAALLPEDRLTFGGYKVRVYLGADDVPSPSERGLARPRTAQGAVAVAAEAPGASGFPTPSPIHLPAADDDGVVDLEIIDDSGDSGWRQLIGTPRRDDPDVPDLLIELE